MNDQLLNNYAFHILMRQSIVSRITNLIQIFIVSALISKIEFSIGVETKMNTNRKL